MIEQCIESMRVAHLIRNPDRQDVAILCLGLAKIEYSNIERLQISNRWKSAITY